MIDFKALEFFFAKDEKFQVPFELGKHRKHDDEPKAVLQKHIPKPKKAEVKAPEKQTQPKETQTILRAPIKKAIKKDKFYSEWEEKYKALSAGNLLAKTPFNKHALFIIEKKAPLSFAKKIVDAVNTRLMKTTLIIGVDDLEGLILKHEPTHIIYENSLGIKTTLPTIEFESLNAIQVDPDKKKHLWEELKKLKV